ncbi:MAG: 1,4-alpha-glucan branching protein GlgB [Erysipelotrichaceae bacterium]|jgi:1,4-alpha-glucan branching enzyme|nr:1,4-alpha-glucan branching protein GlgB [Erysipelotrichaceae bacterium]
MAFGLLYDFLMGQSIEAHNYFGAHFSEDADGKRGVIFRLYAPSASDVSVIGEWNGWNYDAHKMNKIDDSGVWEIFIPSLSNYLTYKYHFQNAKGKYVDKIDPFAFYSENRPGTCSKLFDNRSFAWHDDSWLRKRTRNFDQPMSIYEMHLGSWVGKASDGHILSYEEIAEPLIKYITSNGFTHVEFMPLVQYPFDGSWGYQATGFFSIDARYGNPFQLMSLIDRLHQAGIGTILDFAPVHFAKDKWALAEYDGTKLFEYSNKWRVSPWGSLQFDLGKDPVRSFLMSAMNYFIDYFHFDGLRVDAVSNIIYYNGDVSNGVNEGAVEFIKRLNGKIHIAHDSVMMIAEDSTAFAGTTKPTEQGGLGFDYKWDLGWMNDTLKYYSKDPVYKKYDHHKLTFSMAYFYSDNFLLPLSHDEVVHGKGTIINKMWGDYEQKFALVRNLYTYQFAHPGKKLNFMGNELASFDEWDENKSLPWNLKSYPKHDSVSRLIRDLNRIYQGEKAMHMQEHNPELFRWLMVDNADQSVFAFQRKYQDETLVFVFNMTTNFYESIRLPFLEEGTYEELFNSDKDVYGGWGQYNGLPLKTGKGSFEGLPYHLDIKLACLGACIFKKIKK